MRASSTTGSRYDLAIRAADEARQEPALANAATVVLARAHLERFRQTAEEADLVSARAALKDVEAAQLSPRDAVELIVGFGEAAYFDAQYGAAAEQFDLALAQADVLDADARDRLFEWWASMIDLQAQYGPEPDRQRLYGRLLDRAADELRRYERSGAAAYWLVVGARGTGDLERAWGAAQAAWMRAPLIGPRGATLRQDLDRLVTQAIIPERARQLATLGDARAAMTLLQAQWDEMRRKWGQ